MSTAISHQRRDFLKTSSVAGTALVLGFSDVFAENATSESMLIASESHEITPFVKIDANGAVTLFNPRPDMGQGTFQSMPALLAEELCISMDNVKIVQTEGDAKHGNQNAGGSSSVRGLWKPLRTVGAAAREMLISAAAATWGVPVSECKAENGRVLHTTSKRSLGYGELAAKAATIPVPKEPTLKEQKDFTILGKPASRADVPMKVDGTAKFGIDARVSGMVYASVEHSPTVGGKIVSIDDGKALKVKGVKRVVRVMRPLFGSELEGVAVIADSYYAALKGRKALNVTWDTKGFDTFSTDSFYAAMRQAAAKDGIRVEASKGDFSTSTKVAAKMLEAVYETPFVAHAPMEPEAVVAHYKDDGTIEIWASTQGPVWTKRAVAKQFGIAAEKIMVHPQFLGGSFGRKGGLDDFIMEAVHLSKEVKAPVKLVWTREDDITQGPFRPGMVNALSATMDANGAVTGIRHRIVGPSIQFQGKKDTAGKADDWATEGVEPEDSPYGIPNFSVEFAHVPATAPVMWWRSVYASTNMFGHESFIDELAHTAGKDPLEFRLELLAKANPAPNSTGARFQTVLQMLKEKSQWAEKLPQGKGRGVAIARSFESICAHSVTVGRGADGKMRVEKVVVVLDCGMHVNTDMVKAQTEGNIIMGLTAALKDAITFKNGRAEQTNFDTYRVLRINEVPEMDIHIMPSSNAPGGVGEPGLPPLAPALANAVFAATGKRIRTLPMNLDAV
ncbi:MAG: molybdopterin-dependent oxidoreductase [Candidatus Kapabacteria bacterium]|jgi:isoquinoline 1-oxidoreductase beta subunit|nr:molybdopterin-dependent oxidoreductase [Candidatus Kapabacteria bacterium]